MSEEQAGFNIDIPADVAGSEDFKDFVKEADGAKTFDFKALADGYTTLKKSMPSVPESYDFKFPSEYPLDNTDMDLQRQMAKEAGLTQAQYEAVVKHDLARVQRVSEQSLQEVESAKSELKKEWKNDFDKNLGMARKAADAIFGKDFAARADIGNDVMMIKGLYKIASKMGEDVFRQGGTPANAETRPIGVDGKPRLRFKSMGD